VRDLRAPITLGLSGLLVVTAVGGAVCRPSLADVRTDAGLASGATGGASGVTGGASPALGDRASELWARAMGAGADEDDFMRLADAEGAPGLLERAAAGADRRTIAHALGYAEGMTQLAWLADVAADGADAEADAALRAVLEIAARPRRAIDPEDAPELAAGCRRLLALAREASRPPARRRRASSALRMLAEYGCVRLEDVPSL
jgi:hypothetical protein